MNSEENQKRSFGAAATFATTHWSVVLGANEDSSLRGRAALETLCCTYWRPLYAFVRRRGYAVHDAQDLTQSFFAQVLDKHYLSDVDRTKGKFRSFLLAALEHFLANEWRDAHAQKRGGKVAFISMDDDAGERHYLQVPAASLSPEQLFDQQWATALLEEVLARLQREFLEAGKGPLFEELKIFLTGEKRAASYAELAVKLQATQAALKMAVSRMRHRYGELLRAEIARTVAQPEQIDEELRALFATLSL